MRPLLALAILIPAVLFAQKGQEGPRAGWPCVPGRAMDPAYLDISESTGGQLVLLQKGEVAEAGPVMSASFTHPATIVRLVGNLAGTRDIEFPVDSTVESILLLASVQCRERVLVFRPSGVEVTPQNVAAVTQLAAATIVRVDQPEPGKWKVRLSGSGLFVLSVLAKAGIALTQVDFPEASLQLRLSGEAARVGVRLVDAVGARVAALDTPQGSDGVYRTAFPAQAQRYRVLVTGEDAGAWPFQRTHPVLFRPADGSR